jgi:hypothetical protein
MAHDSNSAAQSCCAVVRHCALKLAASRAIQGGWRLPLEFFSVQSSAQWKVATRPAPPASAEVRGHLLGFLAMVFSWQGMH